MAPKVEHIIWEGVCVATRRMHVHVYAPSSFSPHAKVVSHLMFQKYAIYVRTYVLQVSADL